MWGDIHVWEQTAATGGQRSGGPATPQLPPSALKWRPGKTFSSQAAWAGRGREEEEEEEAQRSSSSTS